jgi:hypothetical protein
MRDTLPPQPPGTCESEDHTSRNAAPSAAQKRFRRSRPSAIFASSSCIVGTISFGVCTENMNTLYKRVFIFSSTNPRSQIGSDRNGERDRWRAETEEAHRGHLQVRFSLTAHGKTASSPPGSPPFSARVPGPRTAGGRGGWLGARRSAVGPGQSFAAA